MLSEFIPLGTASAIPTRHRHLSAAALRREDSLLLFDCGEGTQYQLIAGGLKRSRIDAIFITHFHGDHFYGLMGLLSTLALLQRREPLTVVGPAGLEAILRSLPGLANDGLPFPLAFVELDEGFAHAVVYETADYVVEARPLVHRVFTAGFRYREKARPGHLDVERARALGVTDYRHFRRLKEGQSVQLENGRVVAPEAVIGPAQPGCTFAYVTDTRPCEAGAALAEGAGLLYHEATFTEAMQTRAEETGHSTAREAAGIAAQAGVHRLLLGHFSARYPEPTPLVEEARQVFQNTAAAEELKRYALGADAQAQKAPPLQTVRGA